MFRIGLTTHTEALTTHKYFTTTDSVIPTINRGASTTD